jgi:hypothetical protein
MPQAVLADNSVVGVLAAALPASWAATTDVRDVMK